MPDKTIVKECIFQFRPYTEIADDYWNRNYLDYSDRLDNIVIDYVTKFQRLIKNKIQYLLYVKYTSALIQLIDFNGDEIEGNYKCYNHMVYWKREAWN